MQRNYQLTTDVTLTAAIAHKKAPRSRHFFSQRSTRQTSHCKSCWPPISGVASHHHNNNTLYLQSSVLASPQLLYHSPKTLSWALITLNGYLQIQGCFKWCKRMQENSVCIYFLLGKWLLRDHSTNDSDHDREFKVLYFHAETTGEHWR